MSIKMRHNRDASALCCNCGAEAGKSLEMYDVCIGGQVFTICDECNHDLFAKCLKAEVEKNGRAKSGHDMAVIRQRANGTYIKGGASGGSNKQRPDRYSIRYDA